MAGHRERWTWAVCVAQVVGVHAADVPLGEQDLRSWLAGRGLGLVPVAGAATFGWAGPWIARRPARDGSGLRAVVMFGVPSVPIWDPAQTTDEIVDGVVVAPLDIAVWPPPPGEPAAGVVEALVLAPGAGARVAAVAEAVALAGRGFAGDRYGAGAGTFASGRPGSALTLVDAVVLEEVAQERGAPVDHRRNVVVRGTDLNALVGRRFTLGDEVVCEGRRLCEPCWHLEQLNRGGVLRPLVHRGGLRADIVVGGTVRVGDVLEPVAPTA